MRCAAALASAFEEVAQVRSSRSGSFDTSRRQPGFRADRDLCQRLRDVVDRLEGVQHPGAGIADFEDAGDRRLDVSPARDGGSAPFTPGRNHRVSLATLEIRLFLVISSTNDNVLLDRSFTEKVSFGRSSRITIRRWSSRSPREDHPLRITTECAVWSPTTTPLPSASPITARDIGRRHRLADLPDRMAGGRSGRSIERNREVTHAEQSPDRPGSASEMRGQGNSRRGRDGGDRQRSDLSGRVRQARPRQGRRR